MLLFNDHSCNDISYCMLFWSAMFVLEDENHGLDSGEYKQNA